MTRVERIQTALHNIRMRIDDSPQVNKEDSEDAPDIATHHWVTKSEKTFQHILQFLGQHDRDPAITVMCQVTILSSISIPDFRILPENSRCICILVFMENGILTSHVTYLPDGNLSIFSTTVCICTRYYGSNTQHMMSGAAKT